MKYKYFALDIDGTIFSSEEIIYPAYAEAMQSFTEEHGLDIQTPSKERIMPEIGKPVKTIFENLFPDLNDALRNALSDKVLQTLVAMIDNGAGDYYPEIEETVKTLTRKGGVILVASNGRQPYIDAILRAAKIFEYVSNPTYIDGKTIFTKSDILRHYVATGFSAREILMVGDRKSDWDAARAIGCDFAWCEYGHAEKDEIADYEIKLAAFPDLKAQI